MQEQEHDELCINGCGFFGASASGGMCSVCWKKTMSNTQANIAATTVSSSVITTSSIPLLSTKTTNTVNNNNNNASNVLLLPCSPKNKTSKMSSTFDDSNSTSTTTTTGVVSVTKAESNGKDAADDDSEEGEKKVVQKNKARCWECKKKVGYTGIECRCGYTYCASHRYADQHACTFDYKKSGRKVLAQQNPGGGAFSKVTKF